MGFSIERNKGKVSDIKQNIETKRGELEHLEKTKEGLLESGMEVQGSDIDENAQRRLMAQINQALEANAEKGKELSAEMNSDAKMLDDMKVETQESTKSNLEQRKDFEKKKGLLDKFGLGDKMETAISELDDNKSQFDDLNQNLIDTAKELDSVANKLSSL